MHRGTREFVSIDQIHVHPRTLRKVSKAKAEQYARRFEAGDDFPAIAVEHCGGFYTIRDGRHRYTAQLMLGYTTIEVEVVAGVFGN